MCVCMVVAVGCMGSVLRGNARCLCWVYDVSVIPVAGTVLVVAVVAAAVPVSVLLPTMGCIVCGS